MHQTSEWEVDLHWDESHKKIVGVHKENPDDPSLHFTFEVLMGPLLVEVLEIDSAKLTITSIPAPYPYVQLLFYIFCWSPTGTRTVCLYQSRK